jgi:hypothetical protein
MTRSLVIMRKLSNGHWGEKRNKYRSENPVIVLN